MGFSIPDSPRGKTDAGTQWTEPTSRRRERGFVKVSISRSLLAVGMRSCRALCRSTRWGLLARRSYS
ncbi:hypothetical protein GQ600_8373 [Phytophthora cactorum]|nr:hypothetical protein GQ600_8373 [Phytophthora cactorum]